MKAISLWQPWASLWVLGYKIHETRHWPTNVRGGVAVHAAKRWTREQIELCGEEPFRSAIMPHANGNGPLLPLGAYVGVVNIGSCLPVEQVNPSEPDASFGDYSPGRFAWKAIEHWTISPLPARGRQGFWEITPEELEIIRARATRRAPRILPGPPKEETHG